MSSNRNSTIPARRFQLFVNYLLRILPSTDFSFVSLRVPPINP